MLPVGFVEAAGAPENPRKPCSDGTYYKKIRNLWSLRKPIYYEWMKGAGFESDGFRRNTPQELYDIQMETNNLLKYADYCRDTYLLDELSTLYLSAVNNLIETDRYVFYYLPNRPRRSIRNLSEKHKMWLEGSKTDGDESLLESAQFLYLVTDAIYTIKNMEPAKQTPAMKEFVNKLLPVVLDHYKRWIFSEVGPFQVRGWGCKVKGKYVASGMNHFEFLSKKLKRELGDGDSPGYCNAVTDTDMWILAGVVNILSVWEKCGMPAPDASADFKRMYAYGRTGVDLLESRISYRTLKDFSGKSVEAANVDLGAWDAHPDYGYTGDNGMDFPVLRPGRRVSGVGWDLSHARRFVHVFESLYRSRGALGFRFPTRDVMVKLSNQFIYGTFNRDFKQPLFTNFMDGTNGWYRVGYVGRTGFGYGPFDMSIAVLEGGYGFWSKYNKDIEKVFRNLSEMLDSEDPRIRAHVMQHYEHDYWHNYRRHGKRSSKDLKNPDTQSLLIQFLPSLCFSEKTHGSGNHGATPHRAKWSKVPTRRNP